MRRDNSLTMGLCLTGPCIQISLAVISSLGERILSVHPSTLPLYVYPQIHLPMHPPFFCWCLTMLVGLWKIKIMSLYLLNITNLLSPFLHFLPPPISPLTLSPSLIFYKPMPHFFLTCVFGHWLASSPVH